MNSKKGQKFPDSGFDAICKEIEKKNCVVVSVGELGFPNGADIIEINRTLNSRGYENFPDKVLLAVAKRPKKTYMPAMRFSLHRLKK